jgi:hypothetical protein
LEDNVFDINGFFLGRWVTFYEISDETLFFNLAAAEGDGVISSFMLTIQPDVKDSRRFVATYFDWLGKVGGL